MSWCIYKKFMREVINHLWLTQLINHSTFFIMLSKIEQVPLPNSELCSMATRVPLVLNDVLMVDPTLQDLFFILVRFRSQFPIALTADVSKMYRQVLIDPIQTALQRILWCNSVDEPIKIFELVIRICCIVSSNQSSEETCRRLFEPLQKLL